LYIEIKEYINVALNINFWTASIHISIPRHSIHNAFINSAKYKRRIFRRENPTCIPNVPCGLRLCRFRDARRWRVTLLICVTQPSHQLISSNFRLFLFWAPTSCNSEIGLLHVDGGGPSSRAYCYFAYPDSNWTVSVLYSLRPLLTGCYRLPPSSILITSILKMEAVCSPKRRKYFHLCVTSLPI